MRRLRNWRDARGASVQTASAPPEKRFSNLLGLCTCASLALLLTLSTAKGDPDEMPPQPAVSCLGIPLPENTEIYFQNRVSDDGLVSSQSAVYKADLDGDGDDELIAMIQSKAENLPSLKVMIVNHKRDLKNGVIQHLTHLFELKGTYLWEPLSAVFADLDGDGVVEALFSCAYGASVGARLSIISRDPNAEGKYVTARSPFTFHHMELRKNTLIFNDRYDEHWRKVHLIRNVDGSIKLSEPILHEKAPGERRIQEQE